MLTCLYLYETRHPLITFTIYVHMHLFAPLSTCELSKYNQTQVEKPKFSQSFCRLTKHAFSNLARVCGEREEARDKGMAKAKGGI